MKKVYLCLLLSISVFPAQGQSEKSVWVDSVFRSLNIRKKVAQLLMIPVHSGHPLTSFNTPGKDFTPGFLYITGGSLVSHINLLNDLQQKTPLPYLVGMDAEGGPGQILDSLAGFPSPLMLSATGSDSLVFLMGSVVARQLQAIGIHINFAPQADIDLTSENQAQALHYFSNDRKRAAQTAVTFMNGQQAHGLMTVAKHFPMIAPDTDATKEPVQQIDPLDTIGFYPFQELIRNGVKGVLTTHIHLNDPEKKKHVPAGISAMLINDVLKARLHFQGLTFAHLPTLKKTTQKFRAGETALLAFEAGHDVLIHPDDPSSSIKKIVKVVNRNKRLRAQLDASVRKILELKYEQRLYKKPFIDAESAIRQIHRPESMAVMESIYDRAVTLVRDEKNLLPVTYLENTSFVSIGMGTPAESGVLEKYLNKYVPFRSMTMASLSDSSSVMSALDKNSFIVCTVYPSNLIPVSQVTAFISQLQKKHRVVVCSFGQIFQLASLAVATSVMEAYQLNNFTAKATAQIIFGALPARGQLPVFINDSLRLGTGVVTQPLQRLGYAFPESVGMDSRVLSAIDSVAEEAIRIGATPGCHVLVARKGKVILEKSYGWLTYEKRIPVSDQTIYDLASVTKVSATLQTVMFMHERGLIDIYKKASVYLPELKESNKKDFTIKDILTHQAGLWPFLPFWAQTMKDTLHQFYYQSEKSEAFPFPVAKDLYASKSMKDSLWSWIVQARIREKPDRTPPDYRYSDMGFYILQHLAEKLLNQPMEDFLTQNLYEPLGASSLGYLPLTRFPERLIAPTEKDTLFRQSLLIGYVHDQGAAMHGGIAGHAGLFGNANDLAKLGQMLLQRGTYGGQSYFKPPTIDFFTQKQYAKSRRGLGWDKPMPGDKSNPTSEMASPLTFGHTGFTGTCIWVDPEYELVYIFLSNRVYPDMNNTRLLTANIRPRIQDIIYQSIQKQ